MGKRVKRRVGEHKGRSTIAEQWISYTRDMVESPALRVLSRAAILVMHRLEKEHMDHGGAENGRLIVTHRQFESWGIHRDSVSPAIREFIALGFGEVARQGKAGVGGHGEANQFRLTYVNDKYGVLPTDEWRRITTLEEAERIAKEARAKKDAHTQRLGARGGKATQQKKFSAMVSALIAHGNHERKSNNEPTETMSTEDARKPWALSRISVGGGFRARSEP
jgi:hypothetical protein